MPLTKEEATDIRFKVDVILGAFERKLKTDAAFNESKAKLDSFLTDITDYKSAPAAKRAPVGPTVGHPHPVDTPASRSNED